MFYLGIYILFFEYYVQFYHRMKGQKRICFMFGATFILKNDAEGIQKKNKTLSTFPSFNCNPKHNLYTARLRSFINKESVILIYK